MESDSDRIIQIRELYMAEGDIHGNIHDVGKLEMAKASQRFIYLLLLPSEA